MPLGGKKAVTRIAEKTLERTDVQIQCRALVQIARTVHAHLATRLGQIFGCAVLQAVSTDYRITTTQFSIALDRGVHVHLALQALTTHKHWQLPSYSRVNRFAQQGCGTQWPQCSRLRRRNSSSIWRCRLCQCPKRHA